MKRWKRTLCGGLILFCLCWPPIHFTLTQALDWNPWKLFGFAMYSVPYPKNRIEYFGVRGDRVFRLEVERDPSLQDALDRFARHRFAFRSQADASGVLRAILARHSHLDAAQVNIADLHLNRETAIFELRTASVRLSREQLGLAPRTWSSE